MAYAVLGATGNIGQAIIRILLQSPETQIHAFCRSKEKLLKLIPEIHENSRVTVFEGDLESTKALEDCLRGSRAAFLSTAIPGNKPGCSIAQDTAHSVVAALERLESQNERLPRLIVLSSASTDHRLMSHTPKFLLNILYCAFYNTYEDLKKAEEFLRSKASSVSCTFMKPGALCEDVQRGHVLSMESAKSPVSNLDFAAGMVEVAQDSSDRYDGKSVAVNAASNEVAFPYDAPIKIFKGLVAYLIPWSYPYIE